MKNELRLAKRRGAKSAVVASVLTLAGAVCAQAADTMTVVPHSFTMPAGDQGVWIANQVNKLGPSPRIPLGAARLSR